MAWSVYLHRGNSKVQNKHKTKGPIDWVLWGFLNKAYADVAGTLAVISDHHTQCQ